jgi:hypothetical protein
MKWYGAWILLSEIPRPRMKDVDVLTESSLLSRAEIAVREMARSRRTYEDCGIKWRDYRAFMLVATYRAYF